MNYLILIIVGVAGIALGSYFARRKFGGDEGCNSDDDGLIAK